MSLETTANINDYVQLSNSIRFLSMDAVEKAKSGHPGLPLGMADVATVLFQNFLCFDPKNPEWVNRDRFVLSAGHGSMLLYSLLYLTGYEKVTIEQLKQFRQLGSLTPGHPEYAHTPGVETTTGPLGQGIATAVGMAIAERMMNARYGDSIVNHYTYVLASDGDLMEGISHEAISLAGNLELNKLIVLFDDNHITIDGNTDLSVKDQQLLRFKACGWHVEAIDGHNFDEITAALIKAKQSSKPTMIACRTEIARGAPTKAGTCHAHGSPLGEKEIIGARDCLKWDYEPFYVPDSLLDLWGHPGTKNHSIYNEWKEKFEKLSYEEQQCILNIRDRAFTIAEEVLVPFKEKLAFEKPTIATRVSSQHVLEALTPHLPELIGGSADLTPSNNTKSSYQKPIDAHDFSGSYIHYGVREHGMAAAMNGIILHGGLIPYGGTFLVFSDYLKPSLRLSALMEQGVIYVLTHDSIGLGEDGPTHQPIEHIPSLRMIPNVHVFRPCDGIETAESWELALEHSKTPSVLALSRQNLPTLRNEVSSNKTALGGYVLKEAEGKRNMTLIATGSEVHLAMNAQEKLKEDGICATVVSIPCVNLFQKQPTSYIETVLGEEPRIFIEAALPDTWYRYMRANDSFIGMTGFGASAPAPVLYQHFGITEEAIVKEAKRCLVGKHSK